MSSLLDQRTGFLHRFGAASLLVLCSACGGAGSSSDTAAAVPSIMTQPASLTAAVGTPATFSVSANGASLSYQWKRNGTDIAGANAPSYTIPTTMLSDTRTRYSVSVRNGAGSVASSEATLHVAGIGLLAGHLDDSGSIDGAGAVARFNRPTGLLLERSGSLLVAEQQNQSLRRIAPSGQVSTVPSSPLNLSMGLAYDKDGNILVLSGNDIKRVSMSGAVTTIATVPSNTGDSRSAMYFAPTGIATNAAGAMYVTNGVGTRRIAPDGSVTIVEGVNTEESWGTRFYRPRGVAADGAGNVYVADLQSGISRIDANGKLVKVAGGSAAGDADGTGMAAAFGSVGAMAFGLDGNLYVADSGTDSGTGKIRKVTPSGVVTTVAGGGAAPVTVASPLTARLGGIPGLAVDANGDLYITQGNAVLKVQLAPQ